jgi:hypothetical protein
MLWVFAIVAAVGLFWLGYHHPRRRRWLLPRQALPRPSVSAVERQHKHLLAGGSLSDSAVAAITERYRTLLSEGRTTEIERDLRPGTDFALQVQALSRIGTSEARDVLERQLTRTLSRNPIEQAWYWADLAAALRRLPHAPALPTLLVCADAAADLGAGAVLAAEVVAFPNFPETLSNLDGAMIHPALRLVARVSRSCREGTIELKSILQIGFGDLLANLSEKAPRLPDPWLTAAVLEAERFSRRLGHWSRALAPADRTLADRQSTRLANSSRTRADWLTEAAERLMVRFQVAPTPEQAAILTCLRELRADPTRLFPHLPDRRAAWWSEAIRGLCWSRSSVAGPVLAGLAGRLVLRRRVVRGVTVLQSLRGHACPEAEAVLLRAASLNEDQFRQAAASSLGWWPPFDPDMTVRTLRVLRTDPCPETRRAAVSALARLGERAALDEVRGELASEEPGIRISAAHRIAREELSWLWPELQDVAESEEGETALAAVEALETLREHMLGPVR